MDEPFRNGYVINPDTCAQYVPFRNGPTGCFETVEACMQMARALRRAWLLAACSCLPRSLACREWCGKWACPWDFCHDCQDRCSRRHDLKAGTPARHPLGNFTSSLHPHHPPPIMLTGERLPRLDDPRWHPERDGRPEHAVQHAVYFDLKKARAPRFSAYHLGTNIPMYSPFQEMSKTQIPVLLAAGIRVWRWPVRSSRSALSILCYFNRASHFCKPQARLLGLVAGGWREGRWAEGMLRRGDIGKSMRPGGTPEVYTTEERWATFCESPDFLPTGWSCVKFLVPFLRRREVGRMLRVSRSYAPSLPPQISGVPSWQFTSFACRPHLMLRSLQAMLLATQQVPHL